MNRISVIVTTYNWPEALRLCLDSLYAQTDPCYEILVADDGSRPENQEKTRHLLARAPVPADYVLHEDRGFRAGTIRNKAAAKSRGDYLLFVDGDCLAQPDFVARHRQLAERGRFVPGNRILLSQAFTGEVLDERQPLYLEHWPYFLKLRLAGKINRALPMLRLPLGPLRRLQPGKWEKAMTCNLGVWKSDFIAVNGFDEAFEGWGYEDSDLVIRLIHDGVRRKEGRFGVPVLHLWHPHHDRSRQDANYRRLMKRLAREDFTLAERGVDQYLPQPEALS